MLQNPTAQALLSAGVPEDEVLAGLRQSLAEASVHQATAPVQPPARPGVAPLHRLGSGLAQGGGEAPLPEGWEERFDPATGRKFYVDFVNKETRWTRPLPEGATVTPRNASAQMWQGVDPLPRGSTGDSFRFTTRREESSFRFPTLQPIASEEDPATRPAPAAADASQPAAAERSGERGNERGSERGEGRSGSPSAAPKKEKKGGGWQGRLFGRRRETRSDRASTPPPEEQRGPIQTLLLTLGPGRAPAAEQAEAANTLGALVGQEAEEGMSSTDLALRVVDTLGTTGDARVQAALCGVLTALLHQPTADVSADAPEGSGADGYTDGVATAIVEAGALVYVATLLGSPSSTARHAAATLLSRLADRNHRPPPAADAAADALIELGVAPALVGCISSPESRERKLAVGLADRLCERNGCGAFVAAGVASPLARQLVTVAGKTISCRDHAEMATRSA